MILALFSMSFAGDYQLMEDYLESIDKPSPGVEIFNIKNINFKSNSGFVCTYKEELDQYHHLFLEELKKERNKYKRCNFSVYLLYLFDKKEFQEDLYNMLNTYNPTYISEHNVMIRDSSLPESMTVSYICKNCINSQALITENIQRFYHHTCVLDAPDSYSASQVEALKDLTNSKSRRDGNK